VLGLGEVKVTEQGKRYSRIGVIKGRGERFGRFQPMTRAHLGEARRRPPPEGKGRKGQMRCEERERLRQWKGKIGARARFQGG
jgi:hypothetical protein